MSKSHGLVALAGAGLLGLLLAASPPAQAAAVTSIDTFTIVRSGITASALGTYQGQQVFYRDAFDDGAEPPAGGAFFNPAIGQGSYVVLGHYAAAAESGGALGLNSALGGPFVNAAGGGRTLQRALLPTDVDPASTAGLKQAFHSFASFGLFDLVIPSRIGDGYGILLSDGGPPGKASSFDLLVRRDENDNVYIRFQEQDFLNNQVVTMERDLLEAPQGAARIELRLQRGDVASDEISAAYRFWDDAAPLTAGFVEMANTGTFFKHNGWARAGFFAVQAYVPEPGSLALLLVAGAGLAAARRRRRRVLTA